MVGSTPQGASVATPREAPSRRPFRARRQDNGTGANERGLDCPSAPRSAKAHGGSENQAFWLTKNQDGGMIAHARQRTKVPARAEGHGASRPPSHARRRETARYCCAGDAGAAAPVPSDRHTSLPCVLRWRDASSARMLSSSIYLEWGASPTGDRVLSHALSRVRRNLLRSFRPYG